MTIADFSLLGFFVIVVGRTFGHAVLTFIIQYLVCGTIARLQQYLNLVGGPAATEIVSMKLEPLLPRKPWATTRKWTTMAYIYQVCDVRQQFISIHSIPIAVHDMRCM